MTTEITEYTKTEAALAELRVKYKDAVFDVTTTKGMAEAKVARAELRTLRTDLEKERVRIKEPALTRCRLIDSEAKRITVELTALEDPIDAIIKAEENRKEQERLRKIEEERQRVQKINDAIDAIRNVPASLIGKPAIIIKGQLAKLKEQPIEPDFFAEQFRQAEDAHAAAVAKVQEMLQAAVDAEAEAARVKAEREELERIRKENERLQREARERQEADERRAQQEREEAERREREAQAERERQEREAHEANQRRIDSIQAKIRNLAFVAPLANGSVEQIDAELKAKIDPRDAGETFDYMEFMDVAIDAYDHAFERLHEMRRTAVQRKHEAYEAAERAREEAARLEEQRRQQEAQAERQRQEEARLARERAEHAAQVERDRLKNMSLVEAATAVVNFDFLGEFGKAAPKCVSDLSIVLMQMADKGEKRQAATPVKRARNAA